MSFSTVDEIIAYYKKEEKTMKAMIKNRNYNPPTKPWDSKEEGFCVTCKSFTTNYNNRGECSECGTEVTVDISEGEKE